MATYHDRKSYMSKNFLENFRSGKWKNKLISNDLLLGEQIKIGQVKMVIFMI